MDVYSMVTERIIEQLEQGYIPWKKPWASCLDGSFNRISRKSYSLLNQIMLLHEGEYATYKQWHDIGGQVRKDEKAEIVVFWKMQEVQEKDETGAVVVKQIPVLRYYSVFHISQVDNVLPLPKTKAFETEPIEEAEKLLREYVQRESIELKVAEGNRAFYSPGADSITLPALSQFEKAEEFYSTAFHECTHSTLKASRCDRESENKNSYFGGENYSKEELVAELGSSAILNFLGIETMDTLKNSAGYIQGWLKALKNDKRLIIAASGKAEKAVKYILWGEDR